MRITVMIDRAGRIVIPKKLRNAQKIEPGDALELETEGERVILRPVRTSAPLRKERGVWVFRTGKKITAGETDKVLREARENR